MRNKAMSNSRREMRHGADGPKSLNSRRKTSGRRIHHQIVDNKQIKHLQISETQLSVMAKMLENAQRIIRKGVASAKTLAKKVSHKRDVLIWDSMRKGTFTGNVRNDLILNAQ